jgi:nitrate/TMAO reductase-like tetraheme cytochrome c subunit
VNRRFAAAAILLAAAAPLLADPSDFGVPQPHGWIGTTSEWVRGVGLLLAVLNLVLLVWIWRSVRSRGVTATSKAVLFGSILVLPVMVVFLATAHGMEEAMTVDSCGHCHAMEGHVADLRNPQSDSLAAMHYKNRYIQTDHCYTCHSDYGMTGTIAGKLVGLRHTYYNITGTYEKPIKIAKPYPNVRCFGCHFGAQNFLAKHDKDEIPNLLSGKDSCLDCHGPAHHAEEAPPTKQAAR